MKLNHKVLLSVALAGLFAVPAFAKKGPAKTGPANEKICKDTEGYTIPCDDDSKSNVNSGAETSAASSKKPDASAPAEAPKK